MIKNDFHIFPKIEDIELNKPYAITISPPKVRTSKDLRKDIWKFSQELAQICYGFNLEIYFEYSSVSRLHGHGFIEITDISKYLFGLQGLQVLGAICIKPIFANPKELQEDVPPGGSGGSTRDHWLSYCTKQRRIIEPIITCAGSLLTYPMVYKELARLQTP